ncbi:MAG: hypothetical protein EZS28_046737, partial [Streblomastix strix]
DAGKLYEEEKEKIRQNIINNMLPKNDASFHNILGYWNVDLTAKDDDISNIVSQDCTLEAMPIEIADACIQGLKVLTIHNDTNTLAREISLLPLLMGLNGLEQTKDKEYKEDAYTTVYRNNIISNVNILTPVIDKVNLFIDQYKLCLQKVRKITSILDVGDISFKLMFAAIKDQWQFYPRFIDLSVIFGNQMDANLHSLNVLLIHDEILYGNVLYNTIDLIDYVININNQINIINNAPAPDVYSRTEANEIFDTNADRQDTYTKTETDTKLNAKADKSEQIDGYTKTETDDKYILNFWGCQPYHQNPQGQMKTCLQLFVTIVAGKQLLLLRTTWLIMFFQKQ